MTARFSFDELAACAERELKFRQRVYARRLSEGKMRQDQVDREIGMMTAIRDHLRQQAEGETLFGTLEHKR
jgi:hypothetical protein